MPTAIRYSGLIERCSFLQYGRLLRDVGIRIGKPRVELRQRVQHRLRAVDDPHDLPAPFERDLLAGLDLGDVLLDRRAGRARALAREQRNHERYAAATPPIPPTALVAPTRKRRFPRRSWVPPSRPPCRPVPCCRCRSAPYEGRRLANRSIIRDLPAPGRKHQIAESRSESAGCEPYRLERRRLAGTRRMRPPGCRGAASIIVPWIDFPERNDRVAQALAPFRAGLHAVPRRAVRRRDAAAGPARAQRRARSRRRAAPGDRDADHAAAVVEPCRRGEKGDARRRQHLHEQGDAPARAARRRRDAAPLFSRSRRAHAAPARHEPGLRRDRVARWLRAHQSPRDRGGRRHPARAARRSPDRRARARHRSRIRHRGAEGRRGQPSGDHVRRASSACRSAIRCSRSAIRSDSAIR